MSSPLFKLAGAAVRKAAVDEFNRTTVGRLLREAERLKKQAGRGRKLSNPLRKFGKLGWQSAVRELLGTEMGQLARGVERYAKRGGGAWGLLSAFLDAMGPTGALIKAISQPTAAGRSEADQGIQAAMNLLRSFGYEIIPPSATATAADLQRGIAAAQQTLQEAGYAVYPPGKGPAPRSGKLPFGISDTTKTGKPRKRVELPLPTGQTSFSVDHPVVTGKPVRIHESSNVYSIAYDVEKRTLYIRFRAQPEKGMQYGDQKPDRPGPLYAYKHVPAQVFVNMLKAPSKGIFIWDNIRYRGTVSGHQFDYSLIGITGDYVPRKATLKADGEWFVQRSVRSKQTGQLHTSSLPDQLVRSLYNPGQPGSPNRGAPPGPNRGRPPGPNRGR